MYWQRVIDSFMGTAYRPAHEVMVYGVAVCAWDLELFPYLWVYMIQERRVDSVNLCYAVDDTVASWERCDGQDRFEVQYAAVDGDGWHRATVTSASEYVLRAAIDPTARYWVRVRAVCEHHCHIHDTVMEGEWSDTLEFCLNPQGIGDIETMEGGLFNMAPNPARGTVTVKPALEAGEYPAVLSVNDTKGRETMHFTLTDNSPMTVDVGALPAGTYLVTLTSRSRETDTQRLVVER